MIVSIEKYHLLNKREKEMVDGWSAHAVVTSLLT